MSALPAGFSVCPPVLFQSSLEFSFSQGQTELQHKDGQGRISPCGAGRIVSQHPCCIYDRKLKDTTDFVRENQTNSAQSHQPKS